MTTRLNLPPHAVSVARALVFLCGLCGLIASPGAAHADERREPVTHRVSGLGVRGVEGVTTAVGSVRIHRARKDETFLDIARKNGLGYSELLMANPGMDPWLVPEGQEIVLPTEWILPEGRYDGLILNVPEMRLYYFIPGERGHSARVLTFPVGLGRQEWQTPLGDFKIRGKTENPTWVIPESIRQERWEQDRLTDTFIAGGHPDNPLGAYRLELTLPSYAIHGTNKNWGVGMKVSHGCVRMYPEDIAGFFPVVKVGTSGSFVYQTIKVGARDGRVLIEVQEDIYGAQQPTMGLARQLLERRGLLSYVDPELLEAALETPSGMPTDIGYVSLR